MGIIHGTEKEFDVIIQGDYVLVDFYATWCGPCKMLGPLLEGIAQDRDDIKIVKIDVDECPNLSKQFGIMSVPTIILFKNGKPVSTQYGFTPRPLLERWIEDNK